MYLFTFYPALKVHISTPTNDLLNKHGGFQTEYRGEIPMKVRNCTTIYIINIYSDSCHIEIN